MDDMVVHKQARVRNVTNDRKTRHIRSGQLCPFPAFLKIVQYADDKHYYLIHYTIEGEEIADTCHASVDEAMSQAEFEFGTKSHEWREPYGVDTDRAAAQSGDRPADECEREA